MKETVPWAKGLGLHPEPRAEPISALGLERQVRRMLRARF